MKKNTASHGFFRIIKFLVCMVFVISLFHDGRAFGQISAINSVDEIEEAAKSAWASGAHEQALNLLSQGIQEYPQFSHLQKLRGNILTTIRRNEEALQAYEAVLVHEPGNLGIHWAKWSILTRLGEAELAIKEMQHIAQIDSKNPLAQLRLAQEFRKLDRLEESLNAYQRAVRLAPDVWGWRLALARALFDVLDYDGARKEVEGVLQVVKKGSPVETAARNLLMIVYGATKERGRRFQPIYSPEGTGEDLKQWALIRNDAWELFSAGRYQEAEPLLREIITLRPSDHRATYELGITLMELDHFEAAIKFLQKGIDLGASNEVYLDSIFRIGQCMVELERWSEAILHFEFLQEFAATQEAVPVETQESTDEPPIIPGAKVLDKQKVAFWLEKARQHIPNHEKPGDDDLPPLSETLPSSEQNDDRPLRKLEGFEPIHPRASLMGRDADFTWFRFVIPAKMVMRDDMLMGAHEFIPINPGDTFRTDQKDIYLVFALVSASYDEIPLTTQCFLETSNFKSNPNALIQDRVVMTMNEQSGYFRVLPSAEAWQPGLYRCGLFVGDEATAYNHADEVRFRIVSE